MCKYHFENENDVQGWKNVQGVEHHRGHCPHTNLPLPSKYVMYTCTSVDMTAVSRNILKEKKTAYCTEGNGPKTGTVEKRLRYLLEYYCSPASI